MHLLHYNCSVEQLGKRYTLLRPLGSGGMADVYLAWDERDHHEVAIKVIRPKVLDPRVPKRFSREGEIAVTLDHPHIIRIYGDGVQKETFANPDPRSRDLKIPGNRPNHPRCLECIWNDALPLTKGISLPPLLTQHILR